MLFSDLLWLANARHTFGRRRERCFGRDVTRNLLISIEFQLAFLPKSVCSLGIVVVGFRGVDHLLVEGRVSKGLPFQKSLVDHCGEDAWKHQHQMRLQVAVLVRNSILVKGGLGVESVDVVWSGRSIFSFDSLL